MSWMILDLQPSLEGVWEGDVEGDSGAGAGVLRPYAVRVAYCDGRSIEDACTTT